MKKALALILAVLTAVACFASCGKQNNGQDDVKKGTPNFDVPEGGYDGKDVTIKFYHTMGANLREVLVAYIEDFNKLYPNIHIEEEQVGGYDDVRDQINKEITADAQPNIAYCYPDHVALYNKAKAVATLDNLIDSKIEVTRADGSKEILGLTDEQKADFIEGYYSEGQQFGDGLMYTMPFSKSTEVLYYNKTFFDQHNIKVPTTWTEMEEVCRKIKEIDPSSIPLGYDSESNWFITMCEQYKSPYTSATGDHFLFDNETNRNFVKMFRDWYRSGYVTTQKIYGAYTSGLFTQTDAAAVKSYMSIGSSAGATHQRPAMDTDGKYPFQVGIATIPQVDAGNKKVISQGPSVCIFKKSNPQEVIASCPLVKDDQTKFIEEHGKHTGWIANATGLITIYDGAFYLTPITVNAFEYVKEAEKTDAQKLAEEKEALSVPGMIIVSGDTKLPAEGNGTKDVKITWTSDNAAAVVGDGKLTVTMPAAETTVKLTAKLTLGTLTETKEFSVKLAVPKAALDVAGAVAAMKDFTGGQVSDDIYTVTGEVTSSSYNEKYGSYTVWLKDGATEKAFELYSVAFAAGLDSDAYHAADGLKGKTVTCMGFLQKYVNSGTGETVFEMPYLAAGKNPTGANFTPPMTAIK